jgi:hypothetical protein
MPATKKNGRWVKTVTTDSTHPRKGLFTKSPEMIARELASKRVSPKGPGSGMRMLTYFINRAGKGLSPARRRALEKAKALLSERIHRSRWAEHRIELYQPATLSLVTAQRSFDAMGIRSRLEAAHFRVRAISVDYSPHDQRQNIRCEVRWPAVHGTGDLPAILAELERTPGLIELAWHTQPGGSPEASGT